MPDQIEDKKNQLKARMDELQRYVDEYRELEEAYQRIVGIDAGRPRVRAKPVGKDAPPVGAPGRRGRPKGTGKRAQEALEIVNQEPGLTIQEIADRMGIVANYLYRVMPELEEDDKVEKRGRQWYPIDEEEEDE